MDFNKIKLMSPDNFGVSRQSLDSKLVVGVLLDQKIEVHPIKLS